MQMNLKMQVCMFICCDCLYNLINGFIHIVLFLVVICAEVVVSHSDKVPDIAVYNYSDVVTYTCHTGYELTSGVLSRMCTASGTWTGAAPTCSSKRKYAFDFGNFSRYSVSISLWPLSDHQ